MCNLSLQDTKLTNTGKHPNTYNGVPDWVFEEEVFEDNKALWWSPEGTKLVWGFFNDTLLDSYVLPNYKAEDWEDDPTQYPEYTKVPYPKVNLNETNSCTTLQNQLKSQLIYTQYFLKGTV